MRENIGSSQSHLATKGFKGQKFVLIPSLGKLASAICSFFRGMREWIKSATSQKKFQVKYENNQQTSRIWKDREYSEEGTTTSRNTCANKSNLTNVTSTINCPFMATDPVAWYCNRLKVMETPYQLTLYAYNYEKHEMRHNVSRLESLRTRKSVDSLLPHTYSQEYPRNVRIN